MAAAGRLGEKAERRPDREVADAEGGRHRQRREAGPGQDAELAAKRESIV